MKKKKTWILIGISIIVFLLLLFLFPRITLYGSKKMTIEVGTKYQEPGYKATSFFQTSSNVEVKGTVDETKIGTNTLIYSWKRWGITVTKKRNVLVVDKTAPVLTLKGSNPAILCPNQEYQEEGFTAFDNYDLDLTSKVTVLKQMEQWIYQVVDQSKNQAEIVRKFERIDVTAPVLTLKGDTALSIYVGSIYQDPGYQATDQCDGDLTSQVKVTGSVNPDKIGIYLVTYTVKDQKGNEVSIKRSVEVKARPTYQSTIYLTFDDGPSYLTSQVLDILKEENVKATFFLVHYGKEYEPIVRRMKDEGHTIALHSYTHNYGQVYASEQAYFDDLYAIQAQVKQTTGIESKIIRFPGGSSNTVSNFNKGIMTRLSKKVKAKEFRYFDWNVSGGDAVAGGATADQVYQSTIRGLTKRTTNVVLMHDSGSKKTTVQALKKVIQYGKQQGYSFDRIKEDTPMVTHGINN